MKLLGKIVLLFLALTFLLTACAKPNSGIQGKAVLATCTGQQIATDCTAVSIFSASLEIYNDKLVKLKTIKTKGDGSFQVALKPGTYYVHPVPPTQGKFPYAADFKVIVSADKFTDLTVYYDSGIRPPATEAPQPSP